MFELVLPVVLLVLGMIILTFSSNKTVDHSVILACNWSVPPIVIGLVLVSIGTDFPEIMNRLFRHLWVMEVLMLEILLVLLLLS